MVIDGNQFSKEWPTTQGNCVRVGLKYFNSEKTNDLLNNEEKIK